MPAKLELKQNARVNGGTYIKWTPQDCPMVIETHRGGGDCRKIGVQVGTDEKTAEQSRPCEQGEDVGVRSGSVKIQDIAGGRAGKVGIKLWAPKGNSGPSDEVFVSVK